MITVNEAEKIIQRNLSGFPVAQMPLDQCGGAILAEDILADRDLPPIDRSTMDGIAIKMSSLKSGQRSFLLEGIQKAGTPASRLRSSRGCIEIMTGAVISGGCDCVVPYEDIIITGTMVRIKDGAFIKPFQCIHKKGSDHIKGKVVLTKGCLIRSPQIAILASVGKDKVKIFQRLKIAIISTGDELVSVKTRSIKPYQVRQSNVAALKTAFDHVRLFTSNVYHVKDDPKEMMKVLKGILEHHDTLVLSGGVSKGKFDFVPMVLKKLGVKVLFHRVAQKPGKPFWFGKSKKGKLVFALPGNPVSTLVCAHRYVIPSLKQALGYQPRILPHIFRGKDLNPKRQLTYFIPVKSTIDAQGKLIAQSINISCSGDFAALGHSDGFIELPAHVKISKNGYLSKFFPWE